MKNATVDDYRAAFAQFRQLFALLQIAKTSRRFLAVTARAMSGPEYNAFQLLLAEVPK